MVTPAAVRLNRAATEHKVIHSGLCFAKHGDFME